MNTCCFDQSGAFFTGMLRVNVGFARLNGGNVLANLTCAYELGLCTGPRCD